MPTSSAWKTVLKFVVAVAFIALCNAAVTFALEPYGSKSQVAWTEFQNLDQLDTLIIGTSLVESGIDPDVLDSECNTVSFNLATPDQSLEESLVGIRAAYEDYGTKHVILGVSGASLTVERNTGPDSPFLRQWRLAGHEGQAFAVSNEMLFKHGALNGASSLNWIAPWVGNHVMLRPGDIKRNITFKLTKDDLGTAAEYLDDYWAYLGRGHGASTKTMDKSNTFHRYADAGVEQGSTTIGASHIATLTEIMRYCNDHDIDLLIIAPPMPVHNTIDLDAGYFQVMEQAEALAASEGIGFYDFCRVDTSVFDPALNYYGDNTHLNCEGSEVFTRAFAQLYNRYLQGDDIASYFRAVEDVVASVDYVVAVIADVVSQKDALVAQCFAIAGPGVDVEYRAFWRPYESSEDWVEATGWTTDTELRFVPDVRGPLEVCIQGRKVGSNQDYDSRHISKVLF